MMATKRPRGVCPECLVDVAMHPSGRPVFHRMRRVKADCYGRPFVYATREECPGVMQLALSRAEGVDRKTAERFPNPDDLHGECFGADVSSEPVVPESQESVAPQRTRLGEGSPVRAKRLRSKHIDESGTALPVTAFVSNI